jgi:hypothetical protein
MHNAAPEPYSRGHHVAAAILSALPADFSLDVAGRSARRVGRRETGTSALRRQQLPQAQVVAAGIADSSVADAVGLVDGLLEDLRPGQQRHRPFRISAARAIAGTSSGRAYSRSGKSRARRRCASSATSMRGPYTA